MTNLRWQISRRNWRVVYAITLGRTICKLAACRPPVPPIGFCPRCLDG